MLNTISKHARAFHAEDAAVTSVEYAMMLAVIILGAIGAILSTGDVQRQLFQDTSDDLHNFMNPTN